MEWPYRNDSNLTSELEQISANFLLCYLISIYVSIEDLSIEGSI